MSDDPVHSERRATERCVVLLSGGLDSTTCLAWARERAFACFTLAIDYGQRHHRELDAARQVSRALGAIEHREVRVDLAAIGGSALTSAIAVPKDRHATEIGMGIPITYVPARNTIFLAIALGWAEVLGARHLVAGMNAIDYSGYPDCRPEFVRAFEALAKVATRAGVEGGPLEIHTPLMRLDKAAIIRLGTRLGVDYGLTHSCYDPAPDGAPCGRCDACVLRRQGFRDAGRADPLDGTRAHAGED